MADQAKVKMKSQFKAYLLLIFFGWLGAHRYYVARFKSAILYTFTLGLFGYGLLADIIILYLLVKKRNVELSSLKDDAHAISFERALFVNEKEQLAPWALRKKKWYSVLFDLMDNITRIAIFLIGPLLILLSSLYVDGSLVVGFIVLFVMILVGYVKNMNNALNTLISFIDSSPQIAAIPFLADVVTTIKGFYDYYFENKPKNVFYYLFYPITYLFTFRSNRDENKLYKNLILLILVTLIIESALSVDRTYLSIWVVMGHVLLIAIMVMILAIMPLVPIVTTSFKFRLSGHIWMMRILSTFSILIVGIIIFQENENKDKSTTLFSELSIESKMDNNQFKEDIRLSTDVFLSYYRNKLKLNEKKDDVFIDNHLTDLFRGAIRGIVTEDEAKMFSVVVFTENKLQNSAWLAIEHATLTFGQMKKPIFLFFMSPNGTIYHKWNTLPSKVKDRIQKIDSESVSDDWTPNQVYQMILMDDYFSQWSQPSSEANAPSSTSAASEGESEPAPN